MALEFLNKIGFGKSNDLIGVDIGTTSIKICVLHHSKDGYTLKNLAMKSFEENILSDGNIIDDMFLAQQLKSLIQGSGIKTKDAACALSSYSVIAKRVSVPFLDEEALEHTMNLEVESVIPFPLKDIYYSYYVIGADEEREALMNVQIVAAKKEIIDGYKKAFEMANLSLRLLDVDIFGVTNLIEQIYNPRDASVVAVDIGASITNIAIMKEDSIEFTREVLIGGKHLTSQIEKTMRASFNEAEDKKISADDEVSYLFEDFIYNISSEINKTVNFYASTKPKERIGKVYLTGGSSLLKGLKEAIQGNTGIEVEYVNPFLLLNEDESKMAAHERFREFIPVALYLSSRVTDLGL
jgi:type IV pilus assembly protein PilM